MPKTLTGLILAIILVNIGLGLLLIIISPEKRAAFVGPPRPGDMAP